MFTYFQKELGVQLHSAPVEREFNGKRFFIGHGDGLGPGDYNYKLLKKIFTSKVCQWLFARIHPNLGVGLAHAWSQKSRLVHDKKEQFLGELCSQKAGLPKDCWEDPQTELYTFTAYVFGEEEE